MFCSLIIMIIIIIIITIIITIINDFYIAKN